MRSTIDAELPPRYPEPDGLLCAVLQDRTRVARAELGADSTQGRRGLAAAPRHGGQAVLLSRLWHLHRAGSGERD